MHDAHIVSDDRVVTMEYTLWVGGERIETTQDDGEAVEFLQGHGDVIPGIERAVQGMRVGESVRVRIGPEDGYGELDETQFETLAREEFPDDIPLEVGVELELEDETGETLLGRIVEIQGDTVRLDFNHPLAGMELEFELTIAAVRAATAEELEHGHVHSEPD